MRSFSAGVVATIALWKSAPMLRFEMHASQIQDCIVEQRVEKTRKIAESVWVHNVAAVRTGKVAGQCAMTYTPRWPV